MKRHSSRVSVVLLLLWGLLGTSHIISQDSERLTFDTLYPKNACTKATEQCVTVWGSFDELVHNKEISHAYLTQTLERSLGQLILAQRFLALVPKDAKKPSHEQMHYLSRVIGTIADRFEQLPSIDVDRDTCVQECIAQIKKMVENYLSE